MRFRELRIEASNAVSDHGMVVLVSPHLAFRLTAHHLREIFSALLPRSFTLDGSSVVQITCGPKGSEQQYHQRLGSTEYFVEDFDFAAYAMANASTRQSMLLGIVEIALLDIARRVGSGADTIASTIQAVRGTSFKLEIEIPKLRKRLPGSRATARVFRSLSAELGETWMLRVTGPEQASFEVVMGKSPDYLDRRGYFHSAMTEGREYIVKNRLGNETFRFSEATVLPSQQFS